MEGETLAAKDGRDGKGHILGPEITHFLCPMVLIAVLLLIKVQFKRRVHFLSVVRWVPRFS